jgi:hypothetical protein
MWLSRIPTQITGHFRMDCGTDAEVAVCRRQAAQDWESFLSLRAKELRPGGRLVIVLAGLDDDGASGLQDLMDHANAVLADMVSEGTIRADERRQMVLGTYPRRKCELLAPFDRDGQFQGLTVECCELSPLADPSWADYEHDRDAEALATKRARLFRAIFAPSLSCALGDAVTSHRFAERLEDGLKQRLLNQRTPVHTFVQTMVLAKVIPCLS